MKRSFANVSDLAFADNSVALIELKLDAYLEPVLMNGFQQAPVKDKEPSCDRPWNSLSIGHCDAIDKEP